MKFVEEVHVVLEIPDVVRQLRLENRGGEELAAALLGEAGPLIRPRALFREVFIDEKGEDWVRLENTVFKSRVLRANLERAEKCFPYVLTVGGELEARAAAAGDLLHQYDLESIADMTLSQAGHRLDERIRRRFGFDQLAAMNPGSLEDWPITEQRPLFSLLDARAETIGVRLGESLLMIPRKSVSGILFPTKESFSSCELCPRERCHGRRAAFDEAERRKYLRAGE